MFDKHIRLSNSQRAIIERPLDAKVFLEGPAGCGKTTVAVERILHLMADGVPGSQILLWLPQRTLGEPYYQALSHPGVVAGGNVSVLTLGGLAQRMVDLFWPVVSERAGFKNPNELPVFLTLETAQFYMAHLMQPFLEQGFFDSVVIDRNRIFSQILDNLNKAAVVGFPYTEIGERLKEASLGDPGQLRVYDDTQTCATHFRQYCLAHNLLDFSLQVEIFRDYLWPDFTCRHYLHNTYHYLICDNLEEDTPVAHDVLCEWLAQIESALLVFDSDAGYRRFLGADPGSAYSLKDICTEQESFLHSFVSSPAIQILGARLSQSLLTDASKSLDAGRNLSGDAVKRDGMEIKTALFFQQHRYYPQMLDWVAAQIASLVHDEGVPPSEIVVLAPFLSDALRFLLINRLDALQVVARSHRPSRALRDEPVAQCLLTLACLAHPEWGRQPAPSDVAYALVQAIDGMDLVRAQVLSEIVYRIIDGKPVLSSFDIIRPEMQERITYLLGERYEKMRAWLTYQYEPPDEFDYFLSRLFGELLSQPGYGFHRNYAAGEVTANLVESVKKFRWVAGNVLNKEGLALGKVYMEMVQAGVIAAQYLRSWQAPTNETVIIAPAYTFLMINRPVRIQFWLDVGNSSWSERLEQPLTHPYVLSRSWERGRLWTDVDEVGTSQYALFALATGLLRRCRDRLYLGLSELSEQGYEGRGPLLQGFQRLLRRVS
jgi:hypothetical protein